MLEYGSLLFFSLELELGGWGGRCQTLSMKEKYRKGHWDGSPSHLQNGLLFPM